jgi:hypothetical protein
VAITPAQAAIGSLIVAINKRSTKISYPLLLARQITHLPD